MPWSTENAVRVLGALNLVERAVVRVGRLLLLLLIGGVLALTAYLVMNPPWAGHQGEWFYYGIAVVLVLGWAVSWYVALGRRLDRPSLPFSIESRRDNDAWVWRFQWGANPTGDAAREDDGGLRFRFSRTFERPGRSTFPIPGRDEPSFPFHPPDDDVRRSDERP